MNNEKLRADIKRELSWPISMKKLAELLNRCYVALETPQHARDNVELWENGELGRCIDYAAAPSAPKADDPVKQMLLEALTDSLELMETLCAFEGDTIRKARAAARHEGGKV